VREVVHQLEAHTGGATVCPGQKFKVNVVNAFAVFKAVNQVERRAAYAWLDSVLR
jgi:hypothetical protein